MGIEDLSSEGEVLTPRVVDVTTPNVARMYDYYLGGKDNFEVDRVAAGEILELAPFTPALARANRDFLRRAIRWLVSFGIGQFLDVGTGLPTRSNVHEIAQGLVPGARVVYVDNDPVVVTHGRALLGGDQTTMVREHDLREPETILGDPEIRAFLDFERPMGLMLLSVLHCLSDEEDAYRAVATLMDALAPGSHLVISHITGHDNLTARSTAIYSKATTGMTHRSAEQLAGFFDGCTLLEPGLVRLDRWNPDGSAEDLGAGGNYYLCGVGRKDGAGVGRAGRTA